MAAAISGGANEASKRNSQEEDDRLKPWAKNGAYRPSKISDGNRKLANNNLKSKSKSEAAKT
jgi:hypothetical protein